MTVIRFPLAVIGLLLLAPATGCAGQATNPPAPRSDSAPAVEPPLGTRPATLRLDSVNPCNLLTSEQVVQLVGMPDPGMPGTQVGGDTGGQGCRWGRAFRPREDWGAVIILRHGASYFLGNATGAERTQIGGFPALHSSSPDRNPDTHCISAIDVAPGQTLEVDYYDQYKDRPGMNHRMACQMLDRAAVLMVDNLRTQAR